MGAGNRTETDFVEASGSDITLDIMGNGIYRYVCYAVVCREG